MSKKKDPMALFEVLSRQDNPHSATKVPAWMKRKPADQAEGAESDAAEATDAAEEAVDIADAPDGEYVVDADDVTIAPPEEPEAEDADETAEAADNDEAAEEEVDEDLLDEAEHTDDADEAEADEFIDETTDELDEDELEETEYDADEDDLTQPDTDDEIEDVAEPGEADEAAAQAEAVAVPAPVPPALPSERPSQETRPTPQPWMSVVDERLRIAVPILWAAVAAGGVVMAMVLAFVLGRVTAPTPQADATPTPQAAGNAGIQPLPPDERLQSAETTPKPIVAARSGQREPNRQYLVIQTLQGKQIADFTEAERIIRFAASHGLPADMVYMGSGQNQKLVVWSLLGVTDRDSDAARRHVEKVEQVGKMYFDRYETYDFRQRSDGRLQPFWVSGKAELKR